MKLEQLRKIIREEVRAAENFIKHEVVNLEGFGAGVGFQKIGKTNKIKK